MRGTLGLKHTLCNDLKSVSMVSILSAHWSKSGQRDQLAAQLVSREVRSIRQLLPEAGATGFRCQNKWPLSKRKNLFHLT